MLFLEVTKEVYNKKLKKRLLEDGVKFVEVDVLSELMANVPENKKPKSVHYVHLQFPTLNPKTAKENKRIAKIVDDCYGLVAEESRKSPDVGRPKSYLQDEMAFEIS